ncbi:MAG TPA: TolC family protein [Planctomycetota bacterium]|nr:TolC family protein [Planctomycetota bacterium]HRR78919.1 TolC family protein [Planctomycetota bacterium]HRT92803.1 TolC family protein [Planctomycetota bacterium]
MVGRACVLAGIFLALVAGGCATPQPGRVAPPERRPLGRDLTAFEAPADAAVPRPEIEEPKGPLTLREALALALLHSPELAESAWDIRMAEARVLQAGLGPNPELGFDSEGFGGTRDKKGFGNAEGSLSLAYTIELGGKRLKRVRAAEAEGRLAAWDYETKRLDVLTATAKAFIALVAAQEQVALAEELVALAESILRNVAERVKAGKVSPLEEHKAKGELASARIAREQARHRVAAARRRLATFWGGAEPAFERAVGDLAAAAPPPPETSLAGLLAQNPDLERWADEAAQRRAALELEKANRWPDLNLSPGLGYFGESGAFAWLFGWALPLTVRNRNQGAILEATHSVAKAAEMRRAAEAKARAELAEAYSELAAAFEEIRGIRAEVLPAAQAAYDAASAGFREGKFPFLDVLDAQRTLFDARGNLLTALAEYHKALADVERLIGQSVPLSPVPQPPAAAEPAGGSAAGGPSERSQP